MSLHTLAWLGLFLLLAGLTFRRSSWGIPLYMLTYYALPAAWWWGAGLPAGMRWNLVAALVLAAGVLLDGRTRSPQAGDSARPLLLLLLLYALNASLVHLLFAANPEVSWNGLQILWKGIGLALLIICAVKDRFDLRLLVYALLVGAAYNGYEVVFNDAGGEDSGRLDLVVGGERGNQSAALLAMSLPLGGCLLLFGNRREKCVAIVSLVLILETILRVNSRGIFLGIIGAAVWLVLRTKGRQRKYAIAGIVLGVLAAFVQMDESDESRVLGRFDSTFAPAEERDVSAANRVDFWRQGLKMIGDHPLGSGHAAAFKSDLGYSYIRDLGFDRQHAVHNGYLDTAAGWGIQGLTIFCAALLFAWRCLHTSTSLAYSSGDGRAAFLGCCLEAAFVLELTASFFTSTLDAEWFLWLMAISLAYEYVLLLPATANHPEQECDTPRAYALEPS